MGLDMYLYRYPRIAGLTGKQYDEISLLASDSGTETRVEGEVTYYRYVGLKGAIDFASQLDFVTEDQNDLLNKHVHEVPIGNSSIVRFGDKVGQWRKANAIHKWFVDNVQNGVDDCSSYSVHMGDLVKLRSLVMRVLKDSSLAMELLPPASGFFFGSTEIDDWYWEDLKHTFKTISEVLDKMDWDNKVLMYQSSW
jgi:hypothetical protein